MIFSVNTTLIHRDTRIIISISAFQICSSERTFNTYFPPLLTSGWGQQTGTNRKEGDEDEWWFPSWTRRWRKKLTCVRITLQGTQKWNPPIIRFDFGSFRFSAISDVVLQYDREYYWDEIKLNFLPGSLYSGLFAIRKPNVVNRMSYINRMNNY